MENLATVAANPSALPYYAVAQTGHTIVQITPMANNVVNWDLITVAGSLFNKFIFDKGSFTLQYTQQNTEEWDTTPVLDPVQLMLMQGLYRKALGLPIPPYQQAALDSFFSPPTAERQQGWSGTHPAYTGAYAAALYDIYQRIGPTCFGVGKLCDIPKNACYIGKHCNTCVWVTPEGMEALTNLTLLLLDVGTADTSIMSGKPRPKYNITPSTIPPPPL